ENANPGWWEAFIGPRCALDTDKFFVICVNVIGGCYGSSGPSSINPLTGKSHPSSIAQRYIQRQVLMSDPNWNDGFYYDGPFPSLGMKNARSIATVSYRSGREWETRFGRRKINKSKDASNPCFSADFMIEGYLDHQGESFCLKYDPNSMLYISKAMDLFDLGEGYNTLDEGMSRIKCPVLIMGVQSDLLFPVQQQRELDEVLKDSGNHSVTYYELPSIFGHDTFLLDVNAVAAAIKGHLETDLTFVAKKKSR
ncbi:serine-O-acetyltransferase cys2, partial [Paramuricea clavata]